MFPKKLFFKVATSLIEDDPAKFEWIRSLYSVSQNFHQWRKFYSLQERDATGFRLPVLKISFFVEDLQSHVVPKTFCCYLVFCSRVDSRFVRGKKENIARENFDCGAVSSTKISKSLTFNSKILAHNSN